MTTKAQREQQAADAEHARELLRNVLPVGARVGTVVMHRSASNVQHVVKFITYSPDGGFWDVSGSVARAIGHGWDDKRGGVIHRGGNVEPEFDLVHSLGLALHGDGYSLTRDRL